MLHHKQGCRPKIPLYIIPRNHSYTVWFVPCAPEIPYILLRNS
jgi:hypothetical protein